jgi:flagellum-specific peptidoglycan hydrolase FlgJ
MEKFFIGFMVGAIAMGIMLSISEFKSTEIEKSVEPDSVCIVLEQPEFFLADTPTVELVLQACEYYDVQHADIVVSQAILETGHFRSKLCLEYNNLFGLYNSYKHEFFKFNHWTESVKAYKDKIQNRYNDEPDYYKWLDDLGYAEDPMYINKVQTIQENYL